MWASLICAQTESAASQTASASATKEPSEQLTLEDAIDQAYANSPRIRAAEARVGEAGGRLTRAKIYPHNPVFRSRAALRRADGQRSMDYSLGIGQRVELAGQRRDRRDTAQAELSAERASLLRAQRLLAARVHLAFVAALEARELRDISRRDMQLAERLHELAKRRLARGAGTQLDVNVAAAELGRVEARYQDAEADYRAERAALAEAVGQAPTRLPLPAGQLHVSLDPVPQLTSMVEAARARRADLRALRELETASRARHALARSEAWPDLTVRAFAGREASSETLVGGQLLLPIPLFDRNQGRVEETRARLQRVQAQRAAGELSVEREVVITHARYQAGLRTSARLRQLVLGTLEQNLELLQRSFEAGKASWPEVVVIRRALVDAQRDLTSAEASARRAWIELRVATGQLPVLRGPNPLEGTK